ncbi:MAG TPA: DUF4136 domain-containing protein [Anaeromyxobacteraceae bacterium]|nr:DUF4136 domain-containing protein [Anaeromyxobacteraceae bacterium]
MRSTWWLLAAATALAGCSTVKVRTEYNPQAPFGDYKTYAWNPTPPGPDQTAPARNPAVREMIYSAIDRELAAKGLVKVAIDANPSFIVTALGWAERQVEVSNYGYAYSGSYVYGPYGPGYVATPVVEVRDYRVGTLVLDFSDAQTKKLFWRGTATDTIQDVSTLRASIDDAARKLLADYPPPKPK